MTQTTLRESKYARQLAERLTKRKSDTHLAFKGVLMLRHYSFSRLQKSMGAWAWELLEDGISTGLGSPIPIRKLLKQDKIGISLHGLGSIL